MQLKQLGEAYLAPALPFDPGGRGKMAAQVPSDAQLRPGLSSPMTPICAAPG